MEANRLPNLLIVAQLSHLSGREHRAREQKFHDMFFRFSPLMSGSGNNASSLAMSIRDGHSRREGK
jgi:hypothetical protein